MYPFRAIEPIFNMKAKIVVAYTTVETSRHSAQIPPFRVKVRYPERCVKGLHMDISQCKIIVNEMLARVSISDVY